MWKNDECFKDRLLSSGVVDISGYQPSCGVETELGMNEYIFVLMLVYGAVQTKDNEDAADKDAANGDAVEDNAAYEDESERRLQARHWSRSWRSESLLKRIKDIRKGETNSRKLISEFSKR